MLIIRIRNISEIVYLKFGGTQKCRGTVVENNWLRATVCNLRPSIKVCAAVHMQLKIHDIAADQRKTEEIQKHICRQNVQKPDLRSLAETQFNS